MCSLHKLAVPRNSFMCAFKIITPKITPNYHLSEIIMLILRGKTFNFWGWRLSVVFKCSVLLHHETALLPGLRSEISHRDYYLWNVVRQKCIGGVYVFKISEDIKINKSLLAFSKAGPAYAY